MFLIRCLKLEKEYAEYLNKDSKKAECQPKGPSKGCSNDHLTKIEKNCFSKDPLANIESKPRSDTLEEMREHIAALPQHAPPCSVSGVRPRVGSWSGVRPRVGSGSGSRPHISLERSISAGIYEDDVFLVNYRKFERGGMPYVYDDRKTSNVYLLIV